MSLSSKEENVLQNTIKVWAQGRSLDQVKAVMSIQVLNSFVSGILVVVIPLMMKEKNIDIVTIGLVFASMPIIFQFGRMFFAIVSDFLGRKLFFVLSGFLSVISSSVYYLAHTPLEFLFGKVAEGTKNGSLWAVNRPFLLENSENKWRVLVHLRTTRYVSYALGSLLAGFFIAWLFYDKTLILCAIIGALVIPLSFLLVNRRKKSFSMLRALHLLDFRKKKKLFNLFLILFFILGLSFGFQHGFVFPLFLSENGFDTETIGVLIALQFLLAGLFSQLFAERVKIKKHMLMSGVLYSIIFVLLGFSCSVFAGILVVTYGVVEGLLSIGQEGILSRISGEESYGTDIGLLMMGLHGGTSLSLAMSGLLISMWGFMVPFLLSALILPFFYVPLYFISE